MKNEIDWSKAPEGATHAELNWRGNVKWWFKQDTTGALFYWVPDFDSCWCEEPDPLPACAIAKPWTGEGLPPVGTVCECQDNGMKWLRGTIVYVGTQGVPTAIMQADNEILAGEAGEFRPIRTPEQIAAEERKMAVASMCSVFMRGRDEGIRVIDCCARLYDAGYRKTEGGAQ